MKLPWNKHYLTIAFHVIITVIAIGAAIIIMYRLPQFTGVISRAGGRLISLFGPLWFAVVISFLLNPMVEFIQRHILKRQKKWRVPERRMLATALAYAVFFAVASFLVTLIIRSFGASNAEQLGSAINEVVNELVNFIINAQNQLGEMGILSNLNEPINDAILAVSDWLKASILSLGTALASVGSMALNLALGFIIGFYMLMEKDALLYRIWQLGRAFLPRHLNRQTERFFYDVSTMFSRYVVGQLTDAVIMACMIVVSFTVAGIPYAVVIGVITGFSNLIPYVGAFVAYVLSILMGLLSGEPIKALYAAIIVLVIQQVDSMVIVPKVVGQSVKLHPALVLLALSVFGGLLGLFGMVIAVPVTALIKLYIDRAYEKRRHHHHSHPPKEEEPV